MRAWALSKKPFCELCKSADRLNVHHKTYKRICRERITDLAVLCERCHTNSHLWHKLHDALGVAEGPNDLSAAHHRVGKIRKQIARRVLALGPNKIDKALYDQAAADLRKPVASAPRVVRRQAPALSPAPDRTR
jgi:hypothetical protein